MTCVVVMVGISKQATDQQDIPANPSLSVLGYDEPTLDCQSSIAKLKG